ncbi:MIF4G like-domain-containing protein [Melanogaster broomeanus]|nr:MIF4G like-domain-containing protein [Melanogaster broomeanus]
MSYDRSHRGGGGQRRRQNREREDYDYHDRRREIYDTPEQIIKNAIIKMGEVDPAQEVPRVAKQIRDRPVMVPAISEGIRLGVTEQPFKIPYYAALLRLLHDPAPSETETSGSSSAPSLGKQVLEDFWKGFQGYLDKLAWRDTRLCIHFFAHLMVAQVISIESMSALLQSFATVLDEFGVSYGRGKNAALCAIEGLLIAGAVIKKSSSPNTEEIIKAIQTFNESITSSKFLVQPMMSLHSDAPVFENTDELLECGLRILKAVEASDFLDAWSSVPQPYLDYPDLDPTVSSPFELPSILVPPEVIEIDGLATDAGEDAQVKKEDWPEYFFQLFDNTECARLLLEYPKWCVPGTFKPRSGAPPTEEDPNAKSWQLESAVVETILGSLFLLPEPSHKAVYYIALITELCKLSPSTVGPAVGKSIRKLYASFADGLDVEVARRFAEWFAVHMSNFGFQWVWKEWVPDLALPTGHPKRTFVRRAIVFEIRLSYHDRILKTLPEPMQTDRNVIAVQAPGPQFEYEDPENPYHDAAQSILNLLRGRSRVDEVISHVDTLRTSLESSSIGAHPHTSIDALVRSVVVQSLLSIGCRSFSHLLNAIERYLPLLRSLANPNPAQGGGDATEAKRDILDIAANFWRRNQQMIGIVFDKLMQYQIVDPTDVVAWTFGNAGMLEQGVGSVGAEAGRFCIGAFEWDLVKGALNKANGRVMIARRKVAALRKEQDDSIARAKASGGADANMEVDADVKPIKQDDAAAESPQLMVALKAFTSLTREQKFALSRTIEGFVSCLALSSNDAHQGPYGESVITEQAWEKRSTWSNDEWQTWETWGWYRHFCRMYAPYLRNYATTLSTVGFAKIRDCTNPAAELMRKTWDSATGQEV